MSKPVRITIAEASDVIRQGISCILEEDALSLILSEISEVELLKNTLAWQRPDILIINLFFLGLLSLSQIKKEAANPDMKCVALQTSLADAVNIRYYDDVISVCDSADNIRDKLTRLIKNPETVKRHEPLSRREKETIVCVIKGMTYKQIADKLCLSAHTVNTHRRNIRQTGYTQHIGADHLCHRQQTGRTQRIERQRLIFCPYGTQPDGRRDTEKATVNPVNGIMNHLLEQTAILSFLPKPSFSVLSFLSLPTDFRRIRPQPISRSQCGRRNR